MDQSSLAARGDGVGHARELVCLACGCACDDVGAASPFARACDLGISWLGQPLEADPPHVVMSGEPTALDAAIRGAVEIVRRARYPLVFGLCDTDLDGQRAAIQLADRAGAVIDLSATVGLMPAHYALCETGAVTATWGEVRHRADLVIDWGGDLRVSHPRLRDRYVDESRQRLRVIVCFGPDANQDAIADGFDHRLAFSVDDELPVILALRAIIHDRPIVSSCLSPGSLDHCRQLASWLLEAKYGALLLGSTHVPHPNRVQLNELISELNDFTRLVMLNCGGAGNATGATNVMTWQTGYPFAVSFARGFPQFSPSEYSAEAVLRRGEADAAVVVGSAAAGQLSTTAQRHLQQIPRVELRDDGLPLPVQTDVAIRVTRCGLTSGGTVYRSDGVPMQVVAVRENPQRLPEDAHVLRRITGGLT